MSIAHIDVAAYSLGLLEAKDREAFEAHLAGCQSCSAELAEFAAMADLFAGIGPVSGPADEPDASAVADLLARRAGAQRRRTRRGALLAAAAGIVLLTGGVAAGLGLASPTAQPVAQLSLTGTRHSATNLATGLRGVVGLVSKSWGTQVTLELSKVRGPLDCQLIAVSSTGVRRTLVGWRVPPAGYGVPGHPAPLLLVGGTAIPKQDLADIEIQIVDGRTLLTIPI